MVVLSFLLNVLLVFLGFILIVLVLLQRGRGGGLAGAFGGMGGASAFGTKAGDIFTRITVVVAILWVLTAGVSGLVARSPSTQNAASRASGLRQGADEDEKGASKTTTGATDTKPGEEKASTGSDPDAVGEISQPQANQDVARVLPPRHRG